MLAHGDGDIDAEVAVLREQVGHVCVEHEAVAVVYGRLDPLVYGTRGGLPSQSSPVPIKLQSKKKLRSQPKKKCIQPTTTSSQTISSKTKITQGNR